MEMRRYSVIFGVFTLAAIILIALQSSVSLDAMAENSLKPPGNGNVIGASPIGIDLLSLLIDASARSIFLAAWSSLVTVAIGFLLGVIAAERKGGCFDRIQAMIGNILDGIGSFVIAVCVLSVTTGVSHYAVGTLVAFGSWPIVASVVRQEILATKSLSYYQAGLCLGLTPVKLFIRHVFPNVADRLIPMILALATAFIGLFGALDFIGAGQSSEPQLGALIYDSLNYLRSAPWYLISASSAFALILVVLGAGSEVLRRILGCI